MSFILNREGIRLAVLQIRDIDELIIFKRISTISVAPFFILCILSIGIIYFYSVFRASVSLSVVVLYCLGAMMEVLAEPMYNMYYNKLQLLPRVRAETISVTCRSVVTFFLIVIFDFGVLGFGLAQFVYGLVYLLVMTWHVSMVMVAGNPLTVSSFLLSWKGAATIVWSNTFNVLFRGFPSDPWITLAIYATGSSVLKHMLTEGDKILLSLTANHYNQGIYAITSNYGSLVARIIFQPVEESCRLAFAGILSTASSGGVLATAASKFNLFALYPIRDTRDAIDKQSVTNDKNVLIELSQLLSLVLESMSLFAIIFPVIGAFYTELLIKLFLGPKWYAQETVDTLSSFCCYLYVLGINGISESFVHVVMSPSSIFSFNIALIVSWIVFVSAAIPLMNKYGTSGIVIANAIGMMVRASFNLYFIQSFISFAGNQCTISAFPETHPTVNKTKNKKVKCPVASETEIGISYCSFAHIFPPIRILILSGVISTICFFSSTKFKQSSMKVSDFVIHIAVGSGCFIVFVLASWFYCKDIILTLYRSIVPKKSHID